MNALICLIVGITVLFREIALTRFFSVTVNYSYTAVAISIAILGLTMGSLYYGLNAKRLERMGSPRLLRLLILLAAGACFVPLLPILTLPGGARLFGQLTVDKLRVILPLMSFGPFFLEGILLNRALSRQVDRVRRLYFYNLCGSGAGALLAIIGLKLLGAIGSLIFCAVILAAVGLVIALQEKKRSIRWLSAITAVLLISAALLKPAWQRAFFQIPPSKVIVQDKIEWVGWNTISRVVVSEPGRQNLFRGMAVDERVQKGPYKVASIDSISWGPIIKFDGDFSKVSFLQYEVASLAWAVCSEPTVFVIGPAGGRDVLMSLLLGAKEVYGAEINPIFSELMLGKYYDYSGRIYSRSNVHISTDDGRSALRKLGRGFDIILFNSVETRSATEKGSLNLSENSIFTLEAMQEYWEHLNEDGLLAFSLISDQSGQRPVRFVNLAKTAFQNRGVEDFSKHLLVARVRRTYHYLFKKSPFTASQLQSLKKAAQDKLLKIIWCPDRRNNDPAISAVVQAHNDAELLEEFRFDITPPTDNRPYLFFFPLWRDFFLRAGARLADQSFGNASYTALLTNLKVILLACSLAYILCSFAGQDRTAQGRFRLGTLSLAYLVIVLSLLGRNPAGWLLPSLQSIWLCLPLGGAVVWIAGRRSSLLKKLSRESHLKLPLASAVLALVVALALNASVQAYLAFFRPNDLPLKAILIIAGACPVVLFIVANQKTLFGWGRTKAQHFGYMAMLGVGFLLVELAVLQKLNLLLARPVYSLAVGLGGFLLAAGLGSYLSGLFAWQSRGLRLALAGIVVILLVYVAGLDRIINLCLGWGYPSKILISVGLILPPAVIMGIPFSTGMSLISKTKAEHTGWLYGISSVFSVLGAAASTVISLYGGFTVALFSGAMCYLGALVLAPTTASMDGP